MINVIGLGPGSDQYILPEAINKIKESSVVIGADRNLKSIEKYCKKSMNLSQGFESLAKYIKDNKQEPIAVVVSGDTGFYSMLDFVKRHVDIKNINVIPGISSLQYLFSKLKIGYEGAKWISLHGRESDIKPYIQDKIELGILTDQKKNSRYIATKILEWGFENIKLHIGERLSYSDEKISCLTPQEAETYVSKDLSVVVITYE